MEAIRLKVLAAELRAQWAALKEVFDLLETRAALLRPGDPVVLESLAYHLHNLYSAVEDLCRIVAGAFENNLEDEGQWHIELLRRMRLEIEGVRPALISAELYPLLDELRAFRHFFRHAYVVRLDEERVQAVLQRARQSRPLLQRDLDRFLQQLGASLS